MTQAEDVRKIKESSTQIEDAVQEVANAVNEHIRESKADRNDRLEKEAVTENESVKKRRGR